MRSSSRKIKLEPSDRRLIKAVSCEYLKVHTFPRISITLILKENKREIIREEDIKEQIQKGDDVKTILKRALKRIAFSWERVDKQLFSAMKHIM